MPRSDLPFGSEFSPSQIDLGNVLELASQLGGDWRAFETAVHDAYFSAHKTSEYNRRKLANNTKLGMIAYGLIERDAKLTDFGRALHAIRDSLQSLHARFAEHILKNLHGITLVQCVLDMQVAGETPDLEKLRQWLNERGIHFPRGGKHASIMRLWLEKAGIFVTGWRVDEARFREVLGIAIKEIEALATLSPEQKAYLKQLANMPSDGPFLSNEVEKLAAMTYGVTFSEKNLPKQVLYPLVAAGFISMQRGTKQTGRGAKPFIVTPTQKLQSEVVGPIISQLEQQVQSDIRPLLRKPLADILAELEVEDRYIAGLALEALAFKLMRLIDLDYVATRLRGAATGGAEVDLIFETSRLVFSRWQVQCKNTSRISLDDVAKEVGLTHMLAGKVLVMVTTGVIEYGARDYARAMADQRGLQFVFFDGDDLGTIASSSALILNLIERDAPAALVLRGSLTRRRGSEVYA